jgi:WD40 repeat protein
VTRLPETGQIRGLAWHPDGELLAVAGTNTIRIWNVPRRERAWTVEHQGGDPSLTFNTTGDVLASNTWAGRLRLWNPHSGLELFRVQAPRHNPGFGSENRISVDFPGTNLDSIRRLAQVEVPRAYRTVRAGAAMGGASNYRGCAVHPEGRLLAVGTDEGLSLIDLTTGSERAFLRIGETTGVLFEASGGLLTKVTGHGLLRWPISSIIGDTPVLRAGPPERIPVPAGSSLIAQSRDGLVLAIANGDGAYVWDSDRPQEARYLGPHADCRSVNVSPDGRMVVTGSHNGTGLKVWDARSGRLMKDLLQGMPSGAGRFTADGRWLVSSQGKRWQVSDWNEWPKLNVVVDTVAPDRLLCTSGGIYQGEILLVSPETSHVLARLEDPHQHIPYMMTFSPDGTLLLAVTNEGRCVHIWDLREIRQQLVRLGLDWEGPTYPPAVPVRNAESLAVEVDLGFFGELINGGPGKSE